MLATRLSQINPVTSSSDPNFANVSILLHFDGSNGSTTFTDSSNNNLTSSITRTGTPTVSTTQSKFGGAAGSFNGSQALNVANTTLFTFSGDFTVEGWVYFNSLPSSGGYAGFLFSRGASASASAFQYYLANASGTYRLEQTLSIGSTDYGFTFNLPSTPSTGTWYHFAFVRSGSDVYSFWDGNQAGTTKTASGAMNAPTYNPSIAARQGPYPGLYLNGYLDDFRVTKAARYTANFTVPSAAFPDS